MSKSYKGTLELSGESYEALQRIVTARRSSLKACVQEAVNQWLERAIEKSGTYSQQSIASDKNVITIEGPDSSTSLKLNPQEFERVQQLLGVLRGAIPKAKTALESNLEAFSHLTALEHDLGHGSPDSAVPSSNENIKATIARLRRNKEAIEHRLARLLRA